MSESREGPWGRRDGQPAVITGGLAGDAGQTRARAAAQARVAGDPSLLGNIASTLLLGGFLWWQMGWLVALAVLVGLFVHEYGHVLAMNAFGCGPARIRIVPFLGGAAIPKREPASEFKGVLIALAGPAFGLLAISPFFLAVAITGDSQWLRGVMAVGFLNLFNLAPAPPLDGSKALGPVLARIHPGLERGALVVVGALAVLWCLSRGSWIVGAFIGLSIFTALRRGSLRPFALRLTGAEMGLSVLAYVAVAALCVLTMWVALDGLDLPADPVALLRRFGLR